MNILATLHNKGLERTRRVGVPASRAVVGVSPCRSTQCSTGHLGISGAVVALLGALAFTACDKVYFARIDIGPIPPTQVAVSALTPEEHDRAVGLFGSVAKDLGLTCTPSDYPIITNSYDQSKYQLQRCKSPGHYTQIQFADSRTHVAVEIHEIGGGSESQWFREYRSKFTTAFKDAFPKDRVIVRYPYQWGSPKPVASP